MNTNNGLRLVVGYLGVVILLLACTTLSSGIQLNDDNSFHLESGVVEVRDENGDLVPVASGSTFELVGELEGMDPWVVSGVTFETLESTQVAENLAVGDLVRVRGAILEDETRVAYSIEPAEEQTDPIIILIGIVDLMDPWVVNGIELSVTDETIIQGDITPGMLVRVEILLLSDGTWEVLSIAPLGETIETSGCATVVATVVSVNGNEIQFLGWPIVVTFEPNAQADNDNITNENTGEDNHDNENENENENSDDGESISAGQVVLAVVCVSDDGTLIIVQIIILDTDDEDGDTPTDGEKVLICHKPDKKGGNTLSISSSAVPAHLAHGDKLGACP
jgi:hypothetical protein